MRTSAGAKVAAVTAASLAALVLTTPSALALAPDPNAPVTVPDTVAVYPHGSAIVDVVSNDVDPDDPDGSQLAICRLPEANGDLVVGDGAGLFGGPGTLAVELGSASLPEPVVIEYYVCDRSYLTKATLTVTMRDVAPVTVRKVPGKPGRLKVVNRNDRRIMLAQVTKDDFSVVRVAGHSSRTVRVHARVVRWVATIGNIDNSGVAGKGVVRGIELPKNDSKGRPATSDDIIGGVTTINPLFLASIVGVASSVGAQVGWPPGIGASGS